MNMKLKISPYKLFMFLFVFSVVNFENTYILAFLPILFLILTLFIWLVSYAQRIILSKVVVAMMCFCVFSFFLKDWSQGLWKSIGLPQMPTTLLICFLTFMLIYNVPRTKENVDFVVNAFIISSLVLCFLTIALLKFNISGGLHDNSKTSVLFNYGYNPNSICVCASFAALLRLNTTDKIWYKNWIFLFLVLFSVVTGSRKVIVIFGVYFAAVIMFRSKNIIKSITGLIIVVVLFICLMNLPFVDDIFGERFTDTFVAIKQALSGESFSSIRETRMRMIMIGLDYFKSSPIIGHGWTSFAEQYHLMNNQAAVYSHCNYVEILCSAGIVGFAIYYSKIAMGVFETKNIDNRKKKAECIGMLLALFANDIAAVTYYYKIYYILFAIILLIIEMSSKENHGVGQIMG